NKDVYNENEERILQDNLYNRLAIILIEVPPLNERREDIPLLIEHFVKQISDQQGMTKKKFSKEAIEKLKKYDWTGNIRELRNVVERLLILGEETISASDVQQFANK